MRRISGLVARGRQALNGRSRVTDHSIGRLRFASSGARARHRRL